MEFRWFLFVYIFFSSHFLVNCGLEFQCLKCICETVSFCVTRSCDPEKCDKIEPNNVECSCGPFGIKPGFWIAANKPILEEKAGESEADKFKKCVETFPCSIWAIQYYMNKYAEDCNSDNVINCNDHVLLYIFGPTTCRNASLDHEQSKRFGICMSRTETIHSGVSGESSFATGMEVISENVTQKDEFFDTQPEGQSNGTKEELGMNINYDVFA